MPKFVTAPPTTSTANTVGGRPWQRTGRKTFGPVVAPPWQTTRHPELCVLGTCPECDTQRRSLWANDLRRKLGGVARAWRNEQEAKILAVAKLRKRKPHCRLCGELTSLRVGLWPASKTYPETLAMDLVVSGIQCTYCGNRVAKWAIVTSATLLGEYTV